MQKSLLFLKIFTLSLILVFTASLVNAQTRTAIADGNWNNTTTWGGASVPTSANDVIINNGVSVTVNVAHAKCASITIGATDQTGGITISGTDSLTVTNGVTIGNLLDNSSGITINVGQGVFSCASITMADVTSSNDDIALAISSGKATISGSIVMNGAAGENLITITGAGTLNIDGSISSGTGEMALSANSTVNYRAGGDQGVYNTTYADLIISGGGIKTISSATTVEGILTLSAATLAAGANLSMGTGGIPTIARSGGSLTGSLQGVGDYVVNYSGTSKTTGSELSGSGLRDITVALTAGEILTLDQNRSPDFNLSVNSGIFDLSTFTINRTTSGGILSIADGATLKIGGTNTFPTNYSTHTVGNISATVEYSGTNQAVAALTGAEIYTHLTLSGSGVKTFAAETVNGVLSIQGSATTAGVSPTYGAAAILEYKGSGAQNTSNIEFVGSGANPANVRIDNTNGVTLNVAKSINGALTLLNGRLNTTTTNVLTINTAGSASTSNGAFVNGPLVKLTNSAAVFSFPVGTITGGLRAIGITPQSGAAATYRAAFNSANPKTSVGTNLGTLAQISNCEYWDLAQTSGTTPTKVTLSWPAAANSCGQSYVGNVATLVVAHFTAGAWNNEGQSGFSGTPSAGGTVTSANNLTTFSPFALGTTNANDNPLPVMFAEVKAFQKNSGVEVSWSNLTERDLISYIVERSANGQTFTAVNQQAPRSNTNDKESYTAFDANPIAGVNYYRVKVLEISGKIIYSKVLKVDLSGKQSGISLYPNPVNGTQVSLSINVKQGQYTVKVMNSAGQQIYSQRMIHQGGSMTQTVELPSSVKPGIYNMMVTGDNYRESKQFIVQ